MIDYTCLELNAPGRPQLVYTRFRSCSIRWYHNNAQWEVPLQYTFFGTLVPETDFMRVAIGEAQRGASEGEVPVGAVAVNKEIVIASAHNSPAGRCDPTAHAEILTLRAAAAHLGFYRLEDVDLYVTLEPCLMCFGAMLHARIRRLTYGAPDPKVGFSKIYNRYLGSAQFNHRIEIRSGVLEKECSSLLTGFFRTRR